MTYVILLLAIIAETIGTTALHASHGFTRAVPSVITALSYAVAFYLLALVLKTMSVGIAYAIWSGTGIVLIAVIGFLAFGQRLDLPAVLGMGMIIGGILVIHLFSQTTTH